MVLPAGAARHVGQVLRLGRGEIFVLFNGRGGEFDARIVEARRDQVCALTDVFRDIDRESALRIHLGQGLARGERMDHALQKAVELGVSEMTPLTTRRSMVKLSGERARRRLVHWCGIARHACEQCGRTRLPDVGEPEGLETWVASVRAGLKLVLCAAACATVDDIDWAGDSIALLVGPEGGLCAEELECARDAGFQPLALGPRILRTETAGIAALTAMQLRWGDLGMRGYAVRGGSGSTPGSGVASA